MGFYGDKGPSQHSSSRPDMSQGLQLRRPSRYTKSTGSGSIIKVCPRTVLLFSFAYGVIYGGTRQAARSIAAFSYSAQRLRGVARGETTKPCCSHGSFTWLPAASTRDPKRAGNLPPTLHPKRATKKCFWSDPFSRLPSKASRAPKLSFNLRPSCMHVSECSTERLPAQNRLGSLRLGGP